MHLGSDGCAVDVQLFNILVSWILIVIIALIYVTMITKIRTLSGRNAGMHLGLGGFAVEMQLLNILVLLMTMVTPALGRAQWVVELGKLRYQVGLKVIKVKVGWAEGTLQGLKRAWSEASFGMEACFAL